MLSKVSINTEHITTNGRKLNKLQPNKYFKITKE